MNSKLVMYAGRLAVVGLTLGASVPARAITLLDLMDAPFQIDTPYALSFTAQGSSTTVSIAGFDEPGGEQVTHNGLFLGVNGPNLLGGTWVYAPFACPLPPAPPAPATCGGSRTFNDGTSVPALSFFGLDGFDTYSQTIPTTAGRPYSLDFLFGADITGGADLRVSATTPLPGTLPLLGGALVVLGLIASARRWTAEGTVPLAAA